MRKIAIVGTGLAGLAAGQELRRAGYDGSLSMVGAEPYLPYRRPSLSKEYLINGEDPTLPGAADLAANWLLGQAATGLDLPGRRVLRGRLRPADFDGLIITPGVRPRSPLPVSALPGVVSLHSREDAERLRDAIATRPRVVVVGGGFVGSEVAATLRGLGLTVTLVIRDRMPLRGRLGGEVGRLIAQWHRDHGVDLRVNRRVNEVSGAGRVEQVRLDDGTWVPADLVVAATGSEPALDWLRGSRLRLDDGLVVDAAGLAAPGVAAAGDAVRWPHPLLGGELIRVEHYHNAAEQGRHAARALLGLPAGPYAAIPSFWSHLYGHRLQSVGFTDGAFEVRLAAIEPDGRFIAEYWSGGRLRGVVVAGFVRKLPSYRRAIAESV